MPFFASQGAFGQQESLSPDIQASLESGIELLRDGKIFEARQEFEHTLELDSHCYQAYNNIGLTYYRSGDLKKAAENYMKALELEPVFVPSITNLGAVRHQQKRLKEATNLYKLALKLSEGKDAEIQYNLANVLRDQKDYKEAEKHYNEAIKLRPDFHAAHNGLGATYYCLERLDDAEKEIRAALKLKPDYALAYYHLGLIETARKNYKDAIEAYENSLKYEEDKGNAEDTKGKIAHVRQLMEEKSNAATAKLPPPANNAPPPNLATAIDKNDFKRAANELQLKIALKPRDAVLWNNFGLALRYQKDPQMLDRAINAFKRALELSEGMMYQSSFNLAQALRAKGDLDAADTECLKAIKIAQARSQVCPEVHNLRAMILKGNGKLSKANDEYLVAIQQSAGRFPIFHYNRALLLEKMNKTKEARKEYKTYLERSPHGLNAQRAKMRLDLLNLESAK